METLSPAVIESFNLALQKLTGYERRAYAAALAISHFDGSARKTERTLAVSRHMVELGLKERASGIRCLDAHTFKGRKKKKR
ncbi:hypothetical protein [Tunicatimonas pelagia]|uniref:hypothetical protein n=1 Tax=Tunicatimonas pelagia TaxID=931531 RepID=UPI002667099C|nr:hypothetical protein [Tunicatimonas pelagia]WKN44475.1 hypothetical protein P0M28_05790 [Tunicatimonas pelagia]